MGRANWRALSLPIAMRSVIRQSLASIVMSKCWVVMVKRVSMWVSTVRVFVERGSSEKKLRFGWVGLSRRVLDESYR